VTTRPRPQTAIISKAAKYVSDKRERESADEKARTAALNRWAVAKVGEVKHDGCK
jgi:hypothetical protein